jgi:hypothetical protein
MDGSELRLRPFEIPQTLYRVDYEESATIYHPDCGLEAQDTVSVYNSDRDFRDAVRRHLSWDNGFQSTFISLFSKERHARNWMKERQFIFRSKNCKLLEVCRAGLRDSYVFRAQYIVQKLRLSESVPEDAKRSIANEYLVLHRIPAAAITQTTPALAPQDIIPDNLVEQLESLSM